MNMTHGTQRVITGLVIALLLISAISAPGREFIRKAARATGFAPAPRAVRTGDPFPALAMYGLDGKAVTLDAAQSGTTVYNVFATWCSPCREEAPDLNRAAATLRSRGVRFVGIDQGDPEAAVTAFVTEFSLGYPVVVDTDQISKQSLGARVIPETIVVRDGIVRSISVGPLDTGEFERLVASAT